MFAPYRLEEWLEALEGTDLDTPAVIALRTHARRDQARTAALMIQVCSIPSLTSLSHNSTGYCSDRVCNAGGEDDILLRGQWHAGTVCRW